MNSYSITVMNMIQFCFLITGRLPYDELHQSTQFDSFCLSFSGQYHHQVGSTARVKEDCRETVEGN